MKITLTIKVGRLETKVVIEGYRLMVEALLEAIKKAAREQDKYCEIE